LNPKSIVIIVNTSIKNNVASSILHVHSNLDSLTKTVYHTVNVTTIEAKPFAIRYGINQAIQIPDASHIIVITNAIYLARQIFDSSIYLYQLQSIAIAQDFGEFFNKNTQNSINFWDFLSNSKWIHHVSVNKETKHFNLTTILSCKLSWNFSKKEEYNNII